MGLDKSWFTEASDQSGLAFSLKISDRLHHEQTAYQEIEIYQTTTFGKLMVIDGFIMLSSRDNFIYHEMMTHPVLYCHPDPKHVVIIGGGDCGSLQQVLLHSDVETVIQIDIDQTVTELSQRYFPELCESNHDPRATLLFANGIDWIREAKAASIDIIIVDSTDPIGPATELFEREFYQLCERALRPQGLLVQQSESPLLHQNIIKNMIKSMRSTGFSASNTLHFPQCVYPSGWWSATIAAKLEKPVLRRKQAVGIKKFDTKYYSADIHEAAAVQMPFLKGVTY